MILDLTTVTVLCNQWKGDNQVDGGQRADDVLNTSKRDGEGEGWGKERVINLHCQACQKRGGRKGGAPKAERASFALFNARQRHQVLICRLLFVCIFFLSSLLLHIFWIVSNVSKICGYVRHGHQQGGSV